MKKILLLLQLLFASVAFAQSASLDPFALPLPKSGMYWNPQNSGNGHAIEISKTGSLFDAWFTYGSSGEADFLTIQAQLFRMAGCPADIAKYCDAQRDSWLSRGVTWYTQDSITRRGLLSPLRSSGGACPRCGTRAATTSAAPGLQDSVLFEFYGQRPRIIADDLELLFSDRQEILDSLLGIDGNEKAAAVLRRHPNASVSSNSRYTLRRSPYFESGAENLVYPLKPRIDSLPTERLPGSGEGAIVIEIADEFSYRSCELIFINTQAPHTYFAGNIREGSPKCEVTVAGEAFFTADRMVIWTRQIYSDSDKPVTPGSMVAIQFKELVK